MSDSVTIKSCASSEEAELLRSLLELHGIRAMVMADNYAGLPLLVSGGVQLQVLQNDAEKACKVIDEAQENG